MYRPCAFFGSSADSGLPRPWRNPWLGVEAAVHDDAIGGAANITDGVNAARFADIGFIDGA